MRQLLARCRYFVATLLFLLTTILSGVGSVAFAETGTPVSWSGQGTTNGLLTTVQCSDDTATPGTLLWILTATGADSAMITINGQSFAMSQPNGQSGTFKYVQTGFNGDFSSLVASATYEGDTNGNPQLTISHGCPPAKTNVTPATVSITENCGTENDSYALPADGNGVTYTKTYVNGVLTVTATPDATHTLLAGNEFTLNQDGTATYTYTFTNEACETPKTNVTPAAVTVDEQCGTANDTFSVPADGNGVTYTHTYVGGVLTVVATPDSTHTLLAGNGFTLNQDGTATFTNAACPQPVDLCKNIEGNQEVVPVNMVRGDDGNCYKKVWVCKYVGTPGVDERLKTGNDGLINVSVNAIEHNQWDGTVPGWFSDAQDRSYVLAYDNGQPAPSASECPQPVDVCPNITGYQSSIPEGMVKDNEGNCVTPPCGCHEDKDVTAKEPTFKEVCGYTHDTYTIPSKSHVKYYVNDSPIVTPAGTYHVTAGETVNIEAVADNGYTLTGTHSWSHEFTNVPCVVKVYPPRVEFNNPCETKNDTFTIPSKVGVTYKINNQTVGAGTYNAYDYDVNGTVTVTAVAQEGYKLKGHIHSWSMHFTNEECGGGGGEQTPATPGTATFNDVCATANDTYTIPTTLGVVYKVNGAVKGAGTYPATGAVTVTAEAASAAYVLTGTTSWAHTFTNESCGQVLGDSTVVFTPTPGKGAAVLANTGQNSLTSAIVAFIIGLTAVMVYAFAPKRQLS
ncbi:MAG: hypothetical protein ABIR37_02465 [Candidatus Saccharimonadales bacterium]